MKKLFLATSLSTLALCSCKGVLTEENPVSTSSSAKLESSSSVQQLPSSSSVQVLPLDSAPLSLAVPYDSISRITTGDLRIPKFSIPQTGDQQITCPILDQSDPLSMNFKDPSHLYFCTSESYLEGVPKLKWKAIYDPNSDSLTLSFLWYQPIDNDQFPNLINPVLFQTFFKAENPKITAKTKIGLVQMGPFVDSNYYRKNLP